MRLLLSCLQEKRVLSTALTHFTARQGTRDEAGGVGWTEGRGAREVEREGGGGPLISMLYMFDVSIQEYYHESLEFDYFLIDFRF